MSIDLVIALYRCLVHSLSKNVDTLYFGLASLVNLNKKNPSLILFFVYIHSVSVEQFCNDYRQLWQWEWLAVDGVGSGCTRLTSYHVALFYQRS